MRWSMVGIAQLFAIWALLMSDAAVAVSRCVNADDETLARRKELDIEETCVPVSALIKKSWLEIPTEILEKLAPWPYSEAVWWAPNAAYVRFKMPKTPEHSYYVMCSYRRTVISEIPGPGKYLKHGWANFTGSSIDYKWYLERRGLGQGRTSLNVDAYVSFIPKGNLKPAQELGLCSRDLKPTKADWST